MFSQNTHKRQKADRIGALMLAGILVLAGCAPEGRDEACGAMRSFSRSVESVQNNAQLGILASRLSEDLYGIARQAGNRAAQRHPMGCRRGTRSRNDNPSQLGT